MKWQTTATTAAALDSAAALDLIDSLLTDVAEVIDVEAAKWIEEFSKSVEALRQQATPSVTSAQDLVRWSSHGGDLSASG